MFFALFIISDSTQDNGAKNWMESVSVAIVFLPSPRKDIRRSAMIWQVTFVFPVSLHHKQIIGLVSSVHLFTEEKINGDPTMLNTM